LDRVIALVLGLALAAVAVLAGIEIMELILGNPPLVIPRHTWNSGLRTSHWGDVGMELTSWIVALVGLILLLLQLVPRPPVRLAVRSLPGQRVWLSRKGLGRRLAMDVGEVDGVTGGKMRVGRNRVTSKVVIAAGVDPAPDVEQVRVVINNTLDSIGVVHRFKVRVTVRSADPTGEGTR
jgi:hypothetical protein